MVVWEIFLVVDCFGGIVGFVDFTVLVICAGLADEDAVRSVVDDLTLAVLFNLLVELEKYIDELNNKLFLLTLHLRR